MDLFEHAAVADAHANAPLAERMRPQHLSEFFGQEHVTGEDKLLGRLTKNRQLPSLLFWGPPGVGKTTLARILAKGVDAECVALSAVLSGVKELREAVAKAQENLKFHRKRTVLFVDEIHRFNKSQQDALLPHVENGTVTLLGATTENPSFEVNAALLSRLRVVPLVAIDEGHMRRIVSHAIESTKGLNNGVQVDDDAIILIAQNAHGDARHALTTLDLAAKSALNHRITKEIVEEALQHKALLYDSTGDEHYHVVSAFIKSMRGSDPDASVYWLARMLEAGEDPRFIVRRMVIFASEDIGNADPKALEVSVAALHAFELMGLPEGVLPLTQAVTYLAMAPKSNTAITTYGKAKEAVVKHGALPVPLHIRNAPTSLMKNLGFGANYQYPHDFEGHHVAEEYLPKELKGERFYFPSKNGKEEEHFRRLEELLNKRPERTPGEEG